MLPCFLQILAYHLLLSLTFSEILVLNLSVLNPMNVGLRAYPACNIALYNRIMVFICHFSMPIISPSNLFAKIHQEVVFIEQSITCFLRGQSSMLSSLHCWLSRRRILNSWQGNKGFILSGTLKYSLNQDQSLLECTRNSDNCARSPLGVLHIARYTGMSHRQSVYFLCPCQVA